MKFLPLLWSNLKRKKLRTVLTVLSILLAFVLFGVLAAVNRALDQGASVAGADRLLVRHKVTLTQLLPVSYKDRIAQVPGVTEVTYATWFGGVFQETRYFFAQMPVQPGEWLSMYPEFVVSDEARKAWNQTRTGAIVGRKTAERFGWKVGDRVPIQSMIWPKRDGNMTWEFDLVGIYDGEERGTDTTQFFFRYDYFDEARQFLEGQVGWYLVRVKDPSESATVARRVDDLFTNSAAETKTDTEKAFVASFAKQVGDIGTIVSAIGGVVLFTILLVAGNTMAQAVRERTEELGVLKALGFTNGQVLALVIAEACLLAGLGGLGGLGLAWLMISRGDPTGGFFPVFYFPVQDVWWGIGLAALLGVLSGILPAVQALRLRIADALRRM